MITIRQTKDHQKIRRWVEHRGGRPAVIDVSWNGEDGILRIDFGESGESLEEIDWDAFFRIFDGHNLTFVYQDEEESQAFEFTTISEL